MTPCFSVKQISVVLSLALGSSLTMAAPTIPEAYLSATLQKPMDAKAPLAVTFAIDESRCKRAYASSKDPLANCRRQLGSGGQPVTGVSLKPKRQGYWRWGDNGNTALFYPAEPWNPSEALEVDLSGLTLPKATTLNARQLKTSTLPLSAQSTLEFWPSPDPQKVGHVVAQLKFLTSVPHRATVEKAVTLASQTAGVTLGSPTFLWEQESGKDVALRIQWPVLTTAKDPSAVTLTIAGLSAAPQEAAHASPQGLKIPAMIPGTSNLYGLDVTSVQRVETDAMTIAYNIALQPTLATSAADLAKAIEIYELPEKASPTAIEKADWTKAPVIDAAMLQSAKRLTPTVVNQRGHMAEQVTLQVKAPADRYLLLRVAAGFGPTAERVLKNDWIRVVGLPQANARLTFMEPGNMLTLSGARTLTLHAAGVKSIHWTLYRVRDPYLSLTTPNMEVSDNEEQLASAVSGNLVNPNAEDPDGRFIALKLDSMIPGGLQPGVYDMVIDADKAIDTDRGETLRATKRLIVSDVGLIAKMNQKRPVVFALDVPSGKPKAGLTVDLVGANGIPLETVTTDKDGMAQFSDIAGFDKERAPVAMIARRSPVTMKGSVITTAAAATPSTTTATTAAATSSEKSTAEGDAKATSAETHHLTTGSFEASEVLAWLPIASWQTEDQLWDFDVSGQNLKDDDLTTMLFTDRSLYRPGETVHVGALAKKANWSPIEAGMPLKVEIAPMGQDTLWQELVKTGAHGLAQSNWTIPKDLTPGLYTVTLSAGKTLLAQNTIRVQTFEPESLVLSLRPAVPAAKGWMLLSDSSLLTADLRYGFGSPAAERTLRGRVQLSTPTSLTFDAWKDFLFMLPQTTCTDCAYSTRSAPRVPAPTDLSIVPVKTNEKGEATIALPLSSQLAALRMVHVELEGTDAVGARVTSSEASFFVAPYDTLLGWKSLNSATPLNALHVKDVMDLELALINHTLAPVGNATLTADIAKRRYVTELSADDRGYLSYRDTPALDVVNSVTLTTNTEGLAQLTLPTAEPGEYTVRVKDASGRVLSDIPFFVVGNEIKPQKGLPTAYMKLALDKKSYQPGDTVNVSVLSPFDGTALLSLESNGVLAHQWATVKAGQNQLTFKLPENADGKYWLTTSLVRASSWANRYLKAYSVATQPLIVNRDAHTLKLTLDAPKEQADPQQVTFTLKADAPARVFLWAVDDALLRPTRYEVKDPLTAMMEDRALMTSTYETLIALMPEGLKFPGLSPEGGDGAMKEALRSVLANPFRRQLGDVAVRWLGVVPVDQTAQTYTLHLPQAYQGTMRILAVGANDKQLGLTQTNTIVRSDMSLTPNLPRFATPGDKFAVALSLSAQKPVEATVKATSTGPLSVTPAQKSLSASPEHDATLTLEATTAALPGAASLTFTADAHGVKSTTQTATMSVRPASLKSTESEWGRWQPTKDANGKVADKRLRADRVLLPFEAVGDVRVAESPLPVMSALVTNLSASTPTSDGNSAILASYPWVLLAGNAELTQALGLPPTEVSQRLKATVPTVMKLIDQNLTWQGLTNTFSRPHGDNADTDWWMSAMALDYLLALNERAIPSQAQTLAPRLIQAMRENLYNANVTDPLVAQSVAYAIFEMTRAGVITAEPLEWLRQRLSSGDITWQWKNDPVAIFMAHSYRLMHMTNEARAMMPRQVTLPSGVNQTQAMSLYLTALSLGPVDGLNDPAKLQSARAEATATTLSLLEGMPAQLDQSVALAALRNLVQGDERKAAPALDKVDAVCARYMPGFTPTDVHVSRRGNAVTFSAPGCGEWQLKGATAPLFWSWTQTGYATKVPEAGLSQGLTIRKSLRTAAGDTIKAEHAVKLGDTVTVTLNVSRYQGDKDDTVIVTDLLPAGFELMRGADDEGFLPRIERIDDEDRVVFLVDLREGDTILTYTLRATHPGHFVVPSAEARSSHSPAVKGMTSTGTVSVTP